MISPLRGKRFFSEMSIYDLAQKTGVDPAKISLTERGYKIPREDEKDKIAKALGCEVQDIFPRGTADERKTYGPRSYSET